MESVWKDSARGQVRPSKLIAEALVLGHDSAVVTQRAEEMGLSESLTRAVVSVCCRDQQNADQSPTFESAD